MAALGQRGRLKSILPSCPQILSGRIRNNRPVSQNGTNYYSDLWPAGSIHYRNRTLFTLPANSFVLQQQQRFFGPLISTRNKTSFTSSLPIVAKNNNNNNNKSFRSPLAQLLNTSSLLLPQPISSLDIQCRFRQKKRSRKSPEEEETFSDDEVEDLEDEEFEEESDVPLNYKQLKIHVKSPRADALLSTGLNISRAKIDSMFYASKLLLNDKPLTKKSKNLNEGDCVDLKMENTEDLKVKRVKVLKILSEKSRSDRVCVVVRAWRSPFSLQSIDED